MSHAFISTVVTTMSSLYRIAKDGEIIVENKHINGLAINLESVIITFNHRFSVCNVCCGPPSILMPSISRLASLSTSRATNVKHLKPVIGTYIITYET